MEQLKQRYTVIRTIDKSVHLCCDKDLNFYAAKRVDKQNPEAEILKLVQHIPGCVKLHSMLSGTDEDVLLLEYLEGGDLFTLLSEVKTGLDEYSAFEYFTQIVNIVAQVHALNIIHRDIKPENLVFVAKPENNLKLIDFDLAYQVDDTTKSRPKMVGTPEYVAPEILNGKDPSKASDIWSLGVLLYVMLVCLPPFYEDIFRKITLFEQIATANYSFSHPRWDDVTDEAKDLISKMLVVDPSKRLTIDQVAAHPWMQPM